MSNRTLPTNITITEYKQPGKTFKVKSNSHAVQIHADYSCWDTTSNIYVNFEDCNFKDPA